MHLNECEVAHRHIRGHNAIFIFGPRALAPEECAALAAEYAASYGAMDRPAYLSPAGWQLLDAKEGGGDLHAVERRAPEDAQQTGLPVAANDGAEAAVQAADKPAADVAPPAAKKTKK